MNRMRLAGATALLFAAVGCVENAAPGNDREAELEETEAPADVSTAAAALSGVSTGLLKPEIMTEADVGAVPEMGDPCRFRMTEVGFPVLVYGSSAVVKLNGRLIPLPGTGDSGYASAGLEVVVRPLEPAGEGDGPFEAELVVQLPGASDELGFHGYSECGPRARPGSGLDDG